MNKELIAFFRDRFNTNEFIPLHVPTFNGNEKKYLNECIDSTFVSSVGPFVDEFEELMNQIKLEKKKNFIIDGSSFCNHGFLCKSEHYLNLNFPGIEIQKYYFENNPKDAIANVLYREHAGGNHWKKLENGEYMFYGHHCVVEGPDKGKRQYEVILDNINKLSKNYNIPLTYTPLQIKVQNEEFYEGWKKLILKNNNK